MFFERFREALARLPAGLIRPAAGASAADIAAVQAELGKKLPEAFVAFLGSFDGAELFHDALVLGGAGPQALRGLLDMNPQRPVAEAVFAEAAGGDRFVFDERGRVVRIRQEGEGAAEEAAEADEAPGHSKAQSQGPGELAERWVAGGDFSRWLDGVVAYHRVLYGPDGEFVPEAFEPDGSEVVPLVALKQTERALRACPDSAEWHHERGVAFRRLERLPDARDSFAKAASCDPENPWPQFDLGRVALELGPGAARQAGAAFEVAAILDRSETGARFWAWAARAAALEASPERLEHCRRQALQREPELLAQLRRARAAAALGGEADELAELDALLNAMESPVQPGRMRLQVIAADHPAPAAAAAAPRAPARTAEARRGARPGPASDTAAPAPPRSSPAKQDAARSRAAVSDGSATPARRTPPARPRRPDPAAPPRSGATRPGRRR